MTLAMAAAAALTVLVVLAAAAEPPAPAKELQYRMKEVSDDGKTWEEQGWIDDAHMRGRVDQGGIYNMTHLYRDNRYYIFDWTNSACSWQSCIECPPSKLLAPAVFHRAQLVGQVPCAHADSCDHWVMEYDSDDVEEWMVATGTDRIVAMRTDAPRKHYTDDFYQWSEDAPSDDAIFSIDALKERMHYKGKCDAV